MIDSADSTEATVNAVAACSPSAIARGAADARVGIVPFRTALLYWLKLGFISFGGPAGQIAVMHTELVERRRWISERRFLHALNYCMVLPGPEAQQLATYIGWLLHGTRGGIAAGALFVLPSLFILMALSWIYIAFGHVSVIEGIFYGVKPAVVAIVVAAVIRVGGRAIKNLLTLSFAVASFVALAVFQVPFPWIVLTAGVLGYVGSKVWPASFSLGGGHGPTKDSAGAQGNDSAESIIDDHHEILPHTRPSWMRFAVHSAVGAALWAAPMSLLWSWQGWSGPHTQMGWFFTLAALVTFGGAYAVLPFVAQNAVDVYGWLRPGQMIDGLALGETTPGPLIMVVSFVGFVGGWRQADMGWQGAVLGCVVATYFTFLPSFLFILLGAPFIEQMRGELRLTAALSGITAAVVGVILNLALFFGVHVFLPNVEVSWDTLASFPFDSVDWLALIVSATAFVALWRFKVDVIYVVAACGAIGLATFSLRPQAVQNEPSSPSVSEEQPARRFQRIMQSTAAASRPATGRVTSHESTTSPTLPQRTARASFLRPAPMIAPVETCVVETGRPNQEAALTSDAVARLAVNDSASGIGVSLRASVSRTRRPEAMPPIAIAIVTTANESTVACATSEAPRAAIPSAAIFGASFQPRAKPTNPPLAQ
jgi:chromate transporter